MPLQRDHARVRQLSERLLSGIHSQVDRVIRNGDSNGYPGCINLSFAYVEGESLLMALKVISTFLAFLHAHFLVGNCTFIWQCLYISVVGTLLCSSCVG